MNTIQIVRKNKSLPMPSIQTPGAAGIDLYCAFDHDFIVYTDEVRKIPTGIRAAIPHGYVGLIKERSSLALKGLKVLGGVIDSDYRGEIHVVMTLMTDLPMHYTISPGTRIAQMVVVPCLTGIEEVEELDDSERGENGFGSTGV